MEIKYKTSKPNKRKYSQFGRMQKKKKKRSKENTKQNGRNKFTNIRNHNDSNWMKLKISEHTLDARPCSMHWGYENR